MQPETPEDTKEKKKTAKKQPETTEDTKEKKKTTKKQPETPEDTKEKKKTTKPETPEDTKEKKKTTKKQPETPEDKKKKAAKKQPETPEDKKTKEAAKMQPETPEHTKEKKKTTKKQPETPEDKKKKAAKKQPETPEDKKKAAKMQPETPEDTKEKKKTAKKQPETPEDKKKKAAKKQPETPEDKKKAAKMQAETPEDKKKATKMQPETPEDKKKAAKMQPETPEDTKEKKKTAKKQPETPEDKAQPQATAVDSLLRKTLENHRIRRDERSAASTVINEIKEAIYRHLKTTKCFKNVESPLNTGSYYENLKISRPDEFDVMMPIPVARVSIEPFGEDGAFYSAKFKRGEDPLKQLQEGDTLSASKVLAEFRKEVLKCKQKAFPEWTAEKKKKGCPAVTLTREVQGVTVSMDVVVSVKVNSSWPAFTKDGFKIEKWQGNENKKKYKREPFYLVPKYKGSSTVEEDGVLAMDAWRISFSNIEKDILKSHGSEKTCCQQGGGSCCRKDCLKLLKLLLHSLKEQDHLLEDFCSYHAKTTLLHACCSRPSDSEWRPADLSRCFFQLLEDFVAHLESGMLCNFFIPTQNLLANTAKCRRNRLVKHIREQRDKGFPIFQS